jgi:TolB-like protein
MADIFISYARADRERVEKLAAALEAQGYSVWWDRHIAGGAEFSEAIEKELAAAKAVIVVWSADAIKSRWVKDEAVAAADAGKLIPLTIDGAPAPMGFRQFHLIDLSGWENDASAAPFQDVSRAVKARVSGEHQVAPAAPVLTKALWTEHLLKPVPLAAMGVAVVAIVAFVLLLSRDPASSFETRSANAPQDEGGEIREVSTNPHPEEAQRAVAKDGAITQPSTNSIAVLPFADLSPAGDQEYFSDGIAEEILNVLANVDGLKVASRTSAFRFKGENKSIPTIAGELGVAHVLEGSVRKAGDRIRITAQLISTDSDAHLWSQTYDRKLTVENIFDIQDEIAKKIVDELQITIVPEKVDRALAAKTETTNLDAYELYLNARNLIGYDGAPSVLKKIALYEQAVAIAPDFADAWARLAFNYAILPGWENDYDTDEFQPKAIDAIERAIALDPNSAEIYTFLAVVRSKSFDWGGSDEAYVKANELSPGNPYVAYQQGIQALEKGYFDKAITLFEFAINADPASARPYNFYGLALVSAGRIEEAEAALVHAIELGYTGQTDVPLKEIYLRTGRKSEFRVLQSMRFANRGYAPLAQEIIRVRLATGAKRETEISRFWRVSTELGYDRATLIGGKTDEPGGMHLVDYMTLGEYQILLQPRPAIFLAWVWAPEFDAARKSDAFKQYMRNVNLVAYWRNNGWPDKCRPVGEDDFECE